MADGKNDITSLVPTEDSPKYTSAEEILEALKPAIVDKLKCDDDKIVPDASFIDDLEADSLDMVELVMAIEDIVKFKIPDEILESLKTVGQAVNFVAEKYGLPLIPLEGDADASDEE